jgi:CubicO group peptidase (beta-lactamase class C family)
LPSGGAVDVLLKTPIHFSLGYVKPAPGVPFGSAANAAFGTPGNGGSFGMADPDTGIGYCYAPNRLGFGLLDQREIAIRNALYHDVLGERPQWLS